MPIRWRDYKTRGLHDEALRGPSRPRPVARAMTRYLSRLDDGELEAVRNATELAIKEQGITRKARSTARGRSTSFPG
jgi:uncharacterized circularly permuted ATP-grasp superfamily protein